MVDDPTHVDDVDQSAPVRPVDLRDYVDFSADEARRVRVFGTGSIALDLWCIQPQQSTPVLQYGDADVTYTVVGGRSWFVTEQGEIGLDPMGSLLVPAGVVHGIDNRGADPLIITSSLAPPGDEIDEEDAPDARGLAIRDDAQYARRGRAVRDSIGRLLGR